MLISLTTNFMKRLAVLVPALLLAAVALVFSDQLIGDGHQDLVELRLLLLIDKIHNLINKN